jgi:membrane-associated protease RseP (regulator of RpoE activity)
MRPNFGWRKVLTRSFSVGAILVCATAAWGQASNPTKPTSEPPPAGNASQSSQPLPTTVGEQRRPTEPSATDPQEARGTGPVLGAHFEHGARGAQQSLKITTIDPNSPASQAGLQPNDRLVAIDGRSFANSRQLIAYLSVLGGRPVPIVLERNGREMTLQLFPGQFQGDRAWLGVLLEEDSSAQNPPAQNQNGQNQPGQNATATQAGARPPATSGAANLNPANDEKGAAISQVYPNGPAARAGLRSGDVIIQVNGQKVDDAAELVSLVHEMKPQTQANLDVVRENKPIKVPVTLGSRNQEYMAQFGPGQSGQGQGGQGQFGGPQQFAPQAAQGQWQGNGQFGPGQFGPGQFPGGQMPQAAWQGQGAPNSNEFHQQLSQQNQRIEEELKQLRAEIKQLREQLQKK